MKIENGVKSAQKTNLGRTKLILFIKGWSPRVLPEDLFTVGVPVSAESKKYSTA